MEAAGSGVVGGDLEIHLGVLAGSAPGKGWAWKKTEVKVGCSEDFRWSKRILWTKEGTLSMK